MPKLTVLGGSSIAIPELIAALTPYLRDGRALQVVLHGRDAYKLGLVGRVCAQMAAAVPGLTVEATPDLTAALTGADYVLNQVRVGGLAGRAYDETFPHRWNIPGEETVGPGGAANALRSVPIVLALCRAIEQIAPNATVLTFSNPSSVVQRAITQTTRLNVFGLCDAPYTMHKIAAQTLGVPFDGVDTQYVGMHHFGWITSALVDGEEHLPAVLADDTTLTKLGMEPEIGRITGTLPHPYFRYFFHPDRMLKKQLSMKQPRALELQALEADLLKSYEAYTGNDKPPALAQRSAIWFEAVVAPVIAALAFNVPTRLAVNVTNDTLIPDLPADTIVEVTADIIDGQIQSPAPRKLPPPALFALLQANAAYERTLVDAILQDSADVLLQAFLLNPLIPSYDVAKELVAEIWARRGHPPESNAT
jgi:6-phospho-beta-glucosidase